LRIIPRTLEKAGDVRCRLRYLARLKEKLAVPGGYENILKAEHFDAVVEATKDLCDVAEGKTLNGCTRLEKPHMALKVGQFLSKIAQVCCRYFLKLNRSTDCNRLHRYCYLANNCISHKCRFYWTCMEGW